MTRRSTTANTSSPEHDGDFLARLRGELARRCAGNSRYSLRAFARDLRIDHSTLSQLLRGRRRLTPAAVRRIGPRIGLDRAATNRDALAAGLAVERESSMLRLARELTTDAARTLEEWPHLAILELTRLPDFRADSRFVARVLGIAVDEVNIALQRLLRLGLIEMRQPSRWIDATGPESFERATLRRLLDRLRTLTEEDPPWRTPSPSSRSSRKTPTRSRSSSRASSAGK